MKAISAIALGLVGDSAQAVRFGNDLSNRFPKDTLVQSQYLPMIRAAVILGGLGGSAFKEAEKAIEALAAAERYELGSYGTALISNLYSVYVRAQAYLAAHQGAAAAAEFQKILVHPGVVVNEPIGALAHLGLGRAYALQAGLDVASVGAQGTRPHKDAPTGEGARRAPLQPDALAKARTAYQDFLALWKDADPDIPIFKQAKAEYAKLE